MKTLGYVIAAPAEFAVHQRFGKTKQKGRGISFFVMPFIDRYYFIPLSTNSISYVADQITAENQGVEVSGFAIWKVSDPEKASLSFDFTEKQRALQSIDANLKDVVESAIRHQVANMTIEDVLRKRGSIILQLKRELAYIAEQWGLTIETIEIKNVRIMSGQLFANMQARFRDAMRLEAESSALETEKNIGELRFVQREQLALQEQDFQRRETARITELEQAKSKADAELRAFKMDETKKLKAHEFVNATELLAAEHENKKAAFKLERERIAVERDVQADRFTFETAQKEHQAKVGGIEDRVTRQRIETANTESAALSLVKALPEIASALQVKELNIRDDTLARMAGEVTRLIAREARA